LFVQALATMPILVFTLALYDII